MMRSATISILHAFILPGLATEHVVNNTMGTSADVVDNLADKLVDKLIGKGLGLSSARATQTFTSFPGVKNAQMFASLPGPPALKQKLIGGMQQTNRRCMATKASEKEEAKAWIQAWKDKKGVVTPGGPSLPMGYLTKDQVSEMAGVTGPLGFFDPLGISTNVPEGRLLFYREAELKHGRVCMLAILGLLVAEKGAFIPFLGEGIPENTPAFMLGTPFVQDTPLASFWPAAVFAVFAEEWRRATIIKQEVQQIAQPGDTAPGDYGWDPLGFKPKDAKAFKELQNKELNNGRLAMFAAAGIIAQEQVTGANIFR